MRILHVITSLQTGGAEKLMVDLLPRLRDKGHVIELAIFDGRVTPFYEQLREQRIKIHRFMPDGGNVYNPINCYKLFRLIRNGKYDIVHTHNTAPQLFASIVSRVSSAKFITTEHNTTNRRREWRGFVLVDRWMYKRYSKVICISQKAEENLRQYLGNTKSEICTINNGIEIQKYASAHPSNDLENLAPKSRKLMMVAGFRQQKDQDTLIKSLRYLPSNIHLFLVGDGSRRSELESLVKNEGVDNRVHFLGIRSDIPQLLHAADYVVMSSHWEGFGLAAVEGMAASKPVLATNVPGLREVVSGAGVLFTHQDAKSLAEEILLLEASTEKYNSVAAACRLRANQFDIATMVDAYNKAYLDL